MLNTITTAIARGGLLLRRSWGDEANIITLDMEDGTQKDFEVLNIIEMDGANYIALAELGANEYDILRFVEVEENLELSIIEDDEEYQRAADRFNELFSSEDDITYLNRRIN